MTDHTSTTAILASDFSDKTTDVNRHRWTLAKLQYLVSALAGAPVAIIVDRLSGHAEVGVTLVEAFDGGASRGPRLQIARPDGTTTTFWAPGIGETVIPLVASRAKWDAVRAWMDDRSAAARVDVG